MYHKLGAGWTFVLLSGMCVAALPLAFVVIAYAPGWRTYRAEKAGSGHGLASYLYSSEIKDTKQSRREAAAEDDNGVPDTGTTDTTATVVEVAGADTKKEPPTTMAPAEKEERREVVESKV